MVLKSIQNTDVPHPKCESLAYGRRTNEAKKRCPNFDDYLESLTIKLSFMGKANSRNHEIKTTPGFATEFLIFSVPRFSYL